ncbi:hypothetical protein [Tenacibaculum amylolyticum]|uniref:hypothetical protein n=1 Tax=Tenacibaculum amylolyticum TaxID=104269 RepID=UPI0038945305
MNSVKIADLLELENFRLRTPMYIGEKKISALNSFIHGIYYAFETYNVDEAYILKGFDDWVANYYKYSESTLGWKNMILEHFNYDEEKSLEEFFNLYDKFKKTL